MALRSRVSAVAGCLVAGCLVALPAAVVGPLGLGVASAQQPSAEARDVVLVLVDGEGDEAALTRLEAELRASGFEPVRTELGNDASPVAIRGLAALHEAFAAVREPSGAGAGVVWLRDPSGDYGLRQLDLPADASPAVTALRVVEFLSARQLELALGIPDGPAISDADAVALAGRRAGRRVADVASGLGQQLVVDVPEAAPSPRPVVLEASSEASEAGPWGLEIDLSGVLLLSGVGAQGGPAVRVGWTDLDTGFGLRLGFLGPGFGSGVETPWGDASVRQEIAALDVGLTSVWDPLYLRPWLGIGLLHVVAVGDTAADAFAPALGLGLGGSIALLPWLAARLDLAAFLATGTVEIRAAGNETHTVGAPTMATTFGFAFTL